jgi:hypothetical protein
LKDQRYWSWHPAAASWSPRAPRASYSTLRAVGSKLHAAATVGTVTGFSSSTPCAVELYISFCVASRRERKYRVLSKPKRQ